MTEHKFTRGPWRWTKAYQTSDGRETWTLVSDAYVYGILACDGVENSPQGLNDFGNASLIEAAPDLLQSLIWYVENDDTNEGGKWDEKNKKWIDGKNKAKAAIAKAIGHD